MKLAHRIANLKFHIASMTFELRNTSERVS
jgi:hypothetical protein